MSFDEIAVAYDNSIDWEARLAREIPFISSCLQGRSRILDMACGSGRHSTSLSSRGHDVIGFDTSEVMIHHAKMLASEQGLSPEFIVGNMLHLEDIVAPSFDLILCLGNSLALLPNLKDLKIVFASVSSLLRKDGCFVFQILNFEEILHNGFRFFPIKGGTLPQGSVAIFARFFRHKPEENYSSLIASSFLRQETGWLTDIGTHKVLHLSKELLWDALTASGFGSVEFFSDYECTPFQSLRDRNIIVRARKRPE